MNPRKIIICFLAYAVFASSFGFKFYKHLCSVSDHEEVVLKKAGSCCEGDGCSDQDGTEKSGCCRLEASYLKISEAPGVSEPQNAPDIAFVTASGKALFLSFPSFAQAYNSSTFDEHDPPPRRYGSDLLTYLGTLTI